MAADGPLQWHQRAFGAVAASTEQPIYLCTRLEPLERGGLEVQVWGTADQPSATMTLNVPGDVWPTAGDTPTLVAVEGGRFYVYGGETRLSPGVLLTFDADGRLVEQASLENDGFEKVNATLLPIESRLGPPSTLQIDRSGNVYVPLADPEGFKIVRWTATRIP